MLTYPKKLKIGAHSYTLHFVKHKMSDSDHGEVNKEKGEIYIDVDLIETEKFATVLHETLHVINNELSHEMIEALAQQLTEFLIDNKFISLK